MSHELGDPFANETLRPCCIGIGFVPSLINEIYIAYIGLGLIN